MVVMEGEEYLTAEEARGLLGIKAATLYAYVSRGLLASYRQGIKRQRLYKKSQIEALLGLRPSGKADTSLAASPPWGRSTDSDSDEPEIPAAESWIPYT